MRAISWFRSLFGPKAPEITRSTVGNLTEWERYFIEKSKGHCPDCEEGQFMEGPRGGLAVNVKCDNCGSAFNLVPMGEFKLLHAERIRR